MSTGLMASAQKECGWKQGEREEVGKFYLITLDKCGLLMEDVRMPGISIYRG